MVHKDHIFGFDKDYLVCVKLADGKMTWRERGYGSGQVLLLRDQDLLLVLSEKGDIALVQANPERRVELAKIDAIDGKTWTVPTIVGHKLLVRNDREMVCFDLLLR